MDESPSTSEPGLSKTDFIDFIHSQKSTPSNYFSRQQLSDPKQKEKLRKFRFSLHQAIAGLKKDNCDGPICPLLERRFKDITYKNGQSLKHQKFWRTTRQIISEQKKMNAVNLISILSKIDDGLFKSQCSFEPTKEGMTFMGAAFVQKMIHLDRLRIHCIRTVNLCVGMVELGHLLKIVLLLISMASELASEANRRYLVYKKVYDSISGFLHSKDSRLPSSSKQIPFDSEQEKMKSHPKEANLIFALVNAPSSQERTIAKQFFDELSYIDEGGQISPEAMKYLRNLRNTEHQEILEEVESSSIVKVKRKLPQENFLKKKRR